METQRYISRNAGFTVLEVLLSLALIAVILGAGIPVYQSLQVRNDLDIAATTVAQSVRRAQILAQASDGDTSWGVDVRSGSITIFKGASYASRDASYDETFTLPTSLTPSGTLDYVFAKFTGVPDTTGTVTLTSNLNEIRTLTITSKGTVSY